jgi:hypothetical protein
MKAHALGVILFASIFLASSVQAQVLSDFFFESTEKFIPNPRDDADSLKTSARGGFAKDAIKSMGLASEESEADEDFGPLKESRTKKTNAAYYGTFNTHLAGMHSEAIKEWMNESGKGVVALYKYAQLQTEPSIATGSSLAQDIVFNLQKQVLEGDRTFRQQLEANPELKEVGLATYNGCLKREYEAGKTWLEAISNCQNDSTAAPTGAGFTQIAPKPLEAVMHPDRDGIGQLNAHSNGLPGDVSSARSVSVIDSLVNQVAGATGAGAASGGISNAEATRYATNFKDWFGDILIQFDPGSNNQVVIKEARVKPTRKLSQMLEEITDDRFNRLMSLLRAACESKTGATVTNQITGAQDFWTTTASVEDLRALSTPEIPFRRAIGDALLLVIKNQKGDGAYECNDFNKTVDNVTNNDAYLESYNLYYIFAHHVAKQQLLHAFDKALEITRKLAGTSRSNNALLIKAESLVHEPFSSLDFAELRRKNMALMSKNLQKHLFEIQSQETGQAGSRAASSVNQGGAPR